MTATPRAEIDIRGIRVGFLRRDIRQITDRERAAVEDLVDAVHRDAEPDQTVTRIVIETDYLDPDRLSYVASYHVEVSAKDDDGTGAGASADRGDAG